MTDPATTDAVEEAPPESRRSASRFFVKSAGHRSRRPVDVAMVAAGLLLTVASARGAVDRGLLEDSVLGVAGALPSWATGLFNAAYALGAVYVVVVVAAVVVTAPARGRLPLTLLAAVLLASVGCVVASYLVGAGWPDPVPDPVRAQSTDGFPTVRVAAVTAVLLVLRPWVVLAFRRLNALIVTVQCLAAWAIGIAGPSDILGALGIGLVASGVVLVAVGSPGGHPDLGQVTASLGDLGVVVDDLHFLDQQPWGARLLRGTSAAGRPLLVKVYGRDASDAHRAARWWRALLYRDQAMPGASRLQLVEHEALVTILADRAGVPVTAVVAAASSQGDALLVLTAPPPPLADTDGDVDDTVLRDMWADVARLHAAGICHGELTLEHVSVGPDGLVLSGFADGSVAAPPHRRAQEVATLLTSQALRTGADRTVDAALAALGPDRVAAGQPYLQRAALPRSLRGQDDLKDLLAGLSETITDRTGIAPQPQAEVARVRWRDLLQTALVLVAAYALLTTLVKLDWSTVLDSWANASWAWIVVGLVVAQGTSAADSVSTMSVVTTRLPLLPMMMLQYAIKFVGLAISATAGRVALNTAFLARFGVGATVAVTASALDSFAGAVVNVVVVLVALPFANSVPDLQLDPSDETWRIAGALLVGVAVSALTIAVLPKLRARIVFLVKSAWAAVRVVTDNPTRGLLMFGSNLASLLITAVAMACMVEGIHPSLPFGVVVAVTAGAALFASLIPVPGNVGVGEAAIAAGLVAVGVPSGPAFAIAVTQRIATSYLPQVFGAFALRWLRQEEYVG